MIAAPPSHAPTRPRARGLRRRAGGSAGFTLIEIGLVITVIGVVLGLIIPRLRDQSHSLLVSHARRLAVTIRFLRHEAILSGRTYRLTYDLEQQQYYATSADADADPETDSFVGESGLLSKAVTLPPPIGISDVSLPLIAGKLHEGIAYTHFYPDGYVDLTILHIDNGQDAYTLRIDSLSGRVYLTAGYQDFDYSV